MTVTPARPASTTIPNRSQHGGRSRSRGAEANRPSRTCSRNPCSRCWSEYPAVFSGEVVVTLKRRGGPRLRTIDSISVVRDLAAAGLLDQLRLIVSPGVLGAWGRELASDEHSRRIMELVECTVPDRRLSDLDYRQAPR